MFGTELVSWHPCGFLVYLWLSLVFTSCDWLQWLPNPSVKSLGIECNDCFRSSRASLHKQHYVNTFDNQEESRVKIQVFSAFQMLVKFVLFHESFSANTSLLIHPWVDENRGHLKRKATFSQRTCLVQNIENKLEGAFSYTCQLQGPSSLKLRVNGRNNSPNIVGPSMLRLVASVLAVVCKQTQQLQTLLGQQCWDLLRPFARS